MIVITDDSGINPDDPNTYIIPMPEGETVEIMNDSTGEHQILVPSTQFIHHSGPSDNDHQKQQQEHESLIENHEAGLEQQQQHQQEATEQVQYKEEKKASSVQGDKGVVQQVVVVGKEAHT